MTHDFIQNPQGNNKKETCKKRGGRGLDKPCLGLLPCVPDSERRPHPVNWEKRSSV